MSEPRFESHSGPEGPAPGADRFWDEFGRARARRSEPRRGSPDGEAAFGRGPEVGDHQCLEWCPICRGAEVVRATTPPEIRDQWQTLQRDALVTLRAILDAYIERLGDGRRSDPSRVEDIPIE